MSSLLWWKLEGIYSIITVFQVCEFPVLVFVPRPVLVWSSTVDRETWYHRVHMQFQESLFPGLHALVESNYIDRLHTCARGACTKQHAPLKPNGRYGKLTTYERKNEKTISIAWNKINVTDCACIMDKIICTFIARKSFFELNHT